MLVRAASFTWPGTLFLHRHSLSPRLIRASSLHPSRIESPGLLRLSLHTVIHAPCWGWGGHNKSYSRVLGTAKAMLSSITGSMAQLEASFLLILSLKAGHQWGPIVSAAAVFHLGVPSPPGSQAAPTSPPCTLPYPRGGTSSSSPGRYAHLETISKRGVLSMSQIPPLLPALPPPNRYDPVLMPRSCECDLIWRQGLCRCNLRTLR